MVTIDIRDGNITTTDQVLKKAWDDRRFLRKELMTLSIELNKLDAFISVYVERTGASYNHEDQITTTA
jgi:hypothetical protein